PRERPLAAHPVSVLVLLLRHGQSDYVLGGRAANISTLCCPTARSRGTDAALRQMVIIGHSQGGLLAKMTAIDSGTRLWDTVSQRPLDDLILRDETREQLRRTLFLQPLPFVRRVVFIATPHRGSYEAGSWIAHQVAGFASLPKGFVDVMKDL